MAQLDLDTDGEVTLADHNLHVTTLVTTSNGVTGTPLGDVNLDGSVDVLGDGFALIGGLGQSVTSRAQGDLNADGIRRRIHTDWRSGQFQRTLTPMAVPFALGFFPSCSRLLLEIEH